MDCPPGRFSLAVGALTSATCDVCSGERTHPSPAEPPPNFSFLKLWNDAGLPPITPVKTIHFSEGLASIEPIYDASGVSTQPMILTGFPNASSALFRDKWTNSFLYDHFSRDSNFETLLTKKTFLRGTDAFAGEDEDIRVLKGQEAASWLFGEKGERAGQDGKAAYIGLVPIWSFPEILADLQGSLPAFMLNGYSNVFQYRRESLAIWAGRGGDVDSGLHYDENLGGFMLVAKGVKEVLLFPHSDIEHLYMRQELWHSAESSIYIGDILQKGEQGKYKRLQNTHPRLAVIEAGDVIYIPHKWFHEVYTHGDSLGVSAWVRP